MTEATDTEAKAPQPLPRRAWWQWVLGAGLLGAAAVLAAMHYLPTAREPAASVSPVQPQEIRVPAELEPSKTIPAEPGALAGCNVILVTLDTTRADRIGCYGHAGIQTPTMDRLARQGVLFSRVLASGSSTLPSHASILSGLNPLRHGARANGLFHLAAEHTTISEVLAAQGYRTAGFVSAFVLNSAFGVAQGFDHFDADVTDSEGQHVFRFGERPADRTTARAIAWLRQNAEGPYFMWVHYFDPHPPYAPPSPYAERYPKVPYDGEIAFVDAELGRLLDVVAEFGQTDHTLVVVVADHGEGFGQHEELGHGTLLFNSTLHVPMIMACGDRLGGGVNLDRQVGIIDAAPTVLSLLGLDVPPGWEGADLTQPADHVRTIYAETFEGLFSRGVSPLLAAFEWPMKYVYGVRPELYDLSRDPLEEVDLMHHFPNIADRLHARLRDYYGADLNEVLELQPNAPLDPRTRAALESLGYIRGAPAPPPGAPRPDPREMMSVIYRLQRAATEIPQLGLERAVNEMEEVAREHPDLYAAHSYLAECYYQQGEIARAAASLQRCLELYPGNPNVLLFLAVVHTKRADLEAALACYLELLEQLPDHLEALIEAGNLLARSRQFDRAAELFQRAFALQPNNLIIPGRLAGALAAAGRTPEAVALLRESLADDPRRERVRVALAELLFRQQQQPEEALALVREGLALEPGAHELTNLCAQIVASDPQRPSREIGEAAAMMEQLCDETGREDHRYLYTLSIVYGALQRVEEALRVGESAERRATEVGDRPTAAAIRRHLADLREIGAKGTTPVPQDSVPPPAQPGSGRN